MRQIRFRVWDKEAKYFKPVDETGDYMMQPYEGAIYWEGNDISDEVIISQFTGLKDKNGKDIYEGDILKKTYSRDTSGKDIIEFTEVVEHEIKTGKVGTSGFEVIFLETSEIIGNIYENPELLKEHGQEAKEFEL